MTAPTTTHRFYISWEQMHRDTKTLVAKLRAAGTWKGIIAVAHGGLAPAAIIARELDIHPLKVIVVEGYKRGAGDHAAQNEPKILDYPTDVGDGEGWLMIDDIAATGRTAALLRQLVPKAHFAVICAKTNSKQSVDSCAKEISEDTWVYLPWYHEMQLQPLN
jgi:xanthine phosphoribosyltransferase